tara:strand:- start:91 stop:1041 length:951 start_codon:yes stop_codon:yes gene_type:complete
MAYKSIIKEIKRKSIDVLIVGDFMLDHYVYGNVDRLSPEAPIPIVRYKNESFNLGGAGNVLHNLHNLGVKVRPIGIIGNDDPGEKVEKLIEILGVDNYLIKSSVNHTIQKTRIIGDKKQIVRIDKDTSVISEEDTLLILDKISSIIDKVSAVIISDYAKGVCSEKIVKDIINQSAKNNIPVYIDPKGDDFSKYNSATCITPNLVEAEKIISSKINDKKSYISAAKYLKNDLNIDSCMITLGENGLVYVDEKEEFYIDAIKKEVYDVSGAGDTVISSFTAAMVSGIDTYKALCFANHAASSVITHHGTHPININEIN